MFAFFTIFFLTAQAEMLNFVERGDQAKHSVLFIHGTPGSAKVFKGYYEDQELQKHYHMIAVDRIGFGESSNEPQTSLEKHADAVLDLLKNKWPSKTFSCVGHSYGAPICLYLFIKSPNKFRDGILIAGVSNPNRKILRWYNHLANTWVVKLFLSKSFENSNDEMKALKSELYILEPLLEGIDKRILIIHGQKDKIVPFSDSHHLKSKMTNAKLKVLSPENMGHLLIWTEKEYLKEEMKLFLKTENKKNDTTKIN
jgi:pimeloyl-ACP methyl ester carboxylesterase